LVLAIGIPMSFALVVKGEKIENLWGETNFSESPRVKRFRTLNLTGQVIFTKTVPPEMVEILRSGGVATKQALNKVAPIDLKRRGLRGAKLTNAVLTGADLANADLTDADLYAAHLEYANMDSASLNGVRAEQAHLDGAILSKAKLHHACFYQADLQGAFLKEAEIVNGDFESANLMGADLSEATLPQVNFLRAKLQGASFFHAELERANFKHARLQATDVTMKTRPDLEPTILNSAKHISACQAQKSIASKRFTLAAKNKIIEPGPEDDIKTVDAVIKEFCSTKEYIKILDGAPIMVDCGHPMGNNESAFKKRLYGDLKMYACKSPAIAAALLLQGYNEGSRRINFLGAMNHSDRNWPCKIMELLSPEDQRKIQLKWEEINGAVSAEALLRG
jgi:uncharacterized protein YjbI with pentapeptide repeats